jgi:hypothetical protein
MALLCKKSAIATEITITFVADPGNAPLRPHAEAEEQGRLPAALTVAAPAILYVESAACIARFLFFCVALTS